MSFYIVVKGEFSLILNFYGTESVPRAGLTDYLKIGVSIYPGISLH